MKNSLVAAFVLIGISSLTTAQDKVVIPDSILARHVAITGEDCQSDLPGSEVIDLGKGANLYLVQCTMGAYQGSYRAYLTESDGAFFSQVSILDYSELAKGVVSSLDLMEAAYSAETKTLSTFSKGRGLGDCGSSTSSQIYRSEYGSVVIKTTEIRTKVACDGDYKDWPVVFKQ